MSWPCPHCKPITARGSTRTGQPILALLHGIGCDQPVERRLTAVVYLDKTRAA